jgi:cytidylate kinase
MNVITVSREYGAGGGELAQRLAERLGWELLDRELLQQAAAVEGMPDAEIEAMDEKTVGLVDRFRLHPPHERYMSGLRRAAQAAAARGKVVLVGRGSRFLVGDSSDVLRIRLVAPLAWRAERVARLFSWQPEEAMARCSDVDRSRSRFMRYFYGEAAARSASYDLVVNTGSVSLPDLAELVAGLVQGEESPTWAGPASGRRVLTVSREMAAGDAAIIPALAARLGLRVYDREFFEEEARRLGVTENEMHRIDEHPASAKDRKGTGSLRHRYLEVLRQLIGELAGQGGILFVGRGASGFLHDDSRAFHVRIIACMAGRLRKVMEHHWLREEPARKLLDDSDEPRRRFYQDAFGRELGCPLEYHLTVNAGRLGTRTVDLIARAAEQHWTQAEVRV